MIQAMPKRTTGGYERTTVAGEEGCNYLDALTCARAQLADPMGLPTHQRLMRGVRGAS